MINLSLENTYSIISKNKNWVGAIEYCKCYGMQLAVVDTAAKQKLIEQAIVGSSIYNKSWTSVWIGANDRAKEGEFVWQPTGQKVKYSNWRIKMPDNYLGNENCVHIFYSPGFRFKWNDWPCTSKTNNGTFPRNPFPRMGHSPE
ncbi:AAEL004679-PA [Aedes aegypti]|uniref:AAEL004679-PA n=1 Tax=Aedes aegypti TaxID=7159 RepID=Q17C57_AEDAE|nr:AAEL004679-PA [Aedes aegypti]